MTLQRGMLVPPSTQPEIVGTVEDNEKEKLIAGTIAGKMRREHCTAARISPLDKGQINVGVENLHVRLLDYPQRERFEPDISRICLAPFGVDPAAGISKGEFEDIWERLLQGDFYSIGAALQFANFTFELSGVSRTLTHQLVRTRLAAYMQMTTRSCYSGDNFNVRKPVSWTEYPEMSKAFDEEVARLRELYKTACARGVPMEDARYISPVGIETYIIARFPANIFLQVYAQRACPMMEWQICWVVRQMKKLVHAVWPEVAQFAKVPCQRPGGQCNMILCKEQDAKELCEFPWAHERTSVDTKVNETENK